MTTLRRGLGDLPEAVFADVLESDDAYLLVLDLPGVTADSLSVAVEGDRLVLEAERTKAVPEGFEYVDEDRSPFLDLTVPLPPEVDGAGATGEVDRGVLELRLPKAGRGSGTTIPIEDA